MESVLTKKREGPWTLSNIVQINVETGNVESKSFNIVNSNVDVHKVVSTLILHCATSRHHINLKTTLKCYGLCRTNKDFNIPRKKKMHGKK